MFHIFGSKSDLGLCSFYWAFQHGEKKILAYNIKEIISINEAFNNRRKTVTLHQNSFHKRVRLDFDKMIEVGEAKNHKASHKNIICGVIYESDCFTWLLKLDSSFVCCTPGVVLWLEIAYRFEQEKAIYYNNDDYEVNFEKMTRCNINTQETRKIKRVQLFNHLSTDVPSQPFLNYCTNLFKGILGKMSTVSSRVIFFEIPQSPPLKMQALKRKRTIENGNQPSSVSKKASVVPVDPECRQKDSYHVYTERDIVYHATLNETNLQRNNNKFFIIQLLEHSTNKTFAVYFRWGRVGAKGQNNLVTTPEKNLEEAKAIFEKKFYDKTNNEWMDTVHKNFEKVNGKYDFLRVDLKPEDKEIKYEPVESKLNEKIQSLLELICNKKLMETIMQEMSYDSKKTPLGKLTIQQINEGYAALDSVYVAIKLKKKGSELVSACNQFYTKIPHNFGMRTPQLLLTMDDFNSKVQMLETLQNIKVALELMDERVVEILPPLDKYYKSLHCTLDVIHHSDDEFKILEKILESTHGPTHDYKLKLIDSFKVYKENEHKNFKDLGKTLLLWHGSRLSNWLSILKKGLLVAPLEAPATGYMFGKGIYFADVSTKSANYCHMNEKEKEGLLLLSEVSVGTPLQLMRSEDMPSTLPKKYNSVQGVGKLQPSYLEKTVLSSEAAAVFGPLVGNENPEDCELNYNEYVVYDAHQVKLKYLLRVTFELNVNH